MPYKTEVLNFTRRWKVRLPRSELLEIRGRNGQKRKYEYEEPDSTAKEKKGLSAVVRKAVC